jgi:hypothetical protein
MLHGARVFCIPIASLSSSLQSAQISHNTSTSTPVRQRTDRRQMQWNRLTHGLEQTAEQNKHHVYVTPNTYTYYFNIGFPSNTCGNPVQMVPKNLMVQNQESEVKSQTTKRMVLLEQ